MAKTQGETEESQTENRFAASKTVVFCRLEKNQKKLLTDETLRGIISTLIALVHPRRVMRV